MIKMPWFLPLGLGIGLCLTRTALERRRAERHDRRGRDWWLLLLIGWIPILAWIASQFVEQY